MSTGALPRPTIIDSTTKRRLVVGSVIRPTGYEPATITEVNEHVSTEGKNMLEVIAYADDGFMMRYLCFVRKDRAGNRLVVLPT